MRIEKHRGTKMLRTIGVFVLLASVVACSSGLSREAAQIAYHHKMSTMLADCFRLGPVKGELEASWLKSTKVEMEHAELVLTENALKLYGGDVDNVVFINTVKVTKGKNTIFANGAAFKCRKETKQ